MVSSSRRSRRSSGYRKIGLPAPGPPPSSIARRTTRPTRKAYRGQAPGRVATLRRQLKLRCRPRAGARRAEPPGAIATGRRGRMLGEWGPTTSRRRAAQGAAAAAAAARRCAALCGAAQRQQQRRPARRDRSRYPGAGPRRAGAQATPRLTYMRTRWGRFLGRLLG
eukprot:scaffold467_cov403-Prasinococcus_capsulatus_cf.AAC.11